MFHGPHGVMSSRCFMAQSMLYVINFFSCLKVKCTLQATDILLCSSFHLFVVNKFAVCLNFSVLSGRNIFPEVVILGGEGGSTFIHLGSISHVHLGGIETQ